MIDNLASLKDDMVAFIEGHGLKRFEGYVTDEVPNVNWESENPDGWKDFVELAKVAGASFLTMNDVVLDKEDVEMLIDRLNSGSFPADEDVEEARYLRPYVGKTGFVQLGWPHQGVMFLFEASTEWYDRFQHLMDVAEDFGGMMIDEHDQEDED